jgi:hypothetical protein
MNHLAGGLEQFHLDWKPLTITCHCEERSDEAIPRVTSGSSPGGDCFVASLLTMTGGSTIPVRVETVWRRLRCDGHGTVSVQPRTSQPRGHVAWQNRT